MSIGTPVAISSTSSNFGVASGTAFPTTVAAAAGSLIVVCVAVWTATNVLVTSVTDSVGNTYALVAQSPSTSGLVGTAIYACRSATTTLPSGGGITVNVAGGNAYAAAAYSVSGASNGSDATNSKAGTVAATSESLTTGALVNPNEIVFAVTRANSASFTSWSPGTGFTNIGSLGPLDVMVDYAIVSGLTSKTYGPSWTPSATYATTLATFQGALILNASPGSFSLTGQAGSLRAGRKLAANAGAFALTGGPATLKAARKLAALAGDFFLSGMPAMFTDGLTFSVSPGSFSLTGGSANLRVTRAIQAAPASFALSGGDAGLIFGPKQWPIVPPVSDTWTPVPANPDPWTPVVPNADSWE